MEKTASAKEMFDNNICVGKHLFSPLQLHTSNNYQA